MERLMAMISDRHADLYRRYYAERDIAPRPSQWQPRIEELARRIGARSIIDYGCGANRGLSRFSKLRVVDYDPGLPEVSVLPEPADLVVSIHMLEHVEPECVDSVIDHMLSLAEKALLLVVSCQPSTKSLPDGSPWHSFVRDADWWRARLIGFEPQAPLRDRPGSEYAALFAR